MVHFALTRAPALRLWPQWSWAYALRTAAAAAQALKSPYSWSLTGRTLPADLKLNAATGAISGTPTVANGRVYVGTHGGYQGGATDVGELDVYGLRIDGWQEERNASMAH